MTPSSNVYCFTSVSLAEHLPCVRPNAENAENTERNQASCLPCRKLESGRENKMLTDTMIQDRKTNKDQMRGVGIQRCHMRG